MLTVAAVTVTADVATKVAAVRYLTDNPIELGNLLTLRLVYNPGVAFGLGGSAPAPVIIVLTGLAVAGLVVMGWRGTLHPPVPAGLVIGGAVGNLGDRLTGGTVVDMLDVGWWPVFNLADVVLLTGVGLILLLAPRNTPPAANHAGANGPSGD